MNLQQQRNIQAVIYNTTQDKWYVFFFQTPVTTRRLIPTDAGNAYQYITTDEQEAEQWLHKFYVQNANFQEIDNTNAVNEPAAWKGFTFFGVCVAAGEDD
jgi:hypothetical protein